MEQALRAYLDQERAADRFVVGLGDHERWVESRFQLPEHRRSTSQRRPRKRLVATLSAWDAAASGPGDRVVATIPIIVRALARDRVRRDGA